VKKSWLVQKKAEIVKESKKKVEIDEIVASNNKKDDKEIFSKT